jgi:hypothetical protein
MHGSQRLPARGIFRLHMHDDAPLDIQRSPPLGRGETKTLRMARSATSSFTPKSTDHTRRPHGRRAGGWFGRSASSLPHLFDGCCAHGILDQKVESEIDEHESTR